MCSNGVQLTFASKSFHLQLVAIDARRRIGSFESFVSRKLQIAVDTGLSMPSHITKIRFGDFRGRCPLAVDALEVVSEVSEVPHSVQ